MFEIRKTFQIEAAHWLPQAPPEHKCRRLHGHSFRIDVAVAGPIDARSGWVMDFADLKAVCRPVIESLDHRCLNDIEGLENPTSERLAEWLWTRLRPSLPGLREIEVAETCLSRCRYWRSDESRAAEPNQSLPGM